MRLHKWIGIDEQVIVLFGREKAGLGEAVPPPRTIHRRCSGGKGSRSFELVEARSECGRNSPLLGSEQVDDPADSSGFERAAEPPTYPASLSPE